MERLETVKKLKAAKARQKVYEQNECSDDEIDQLLHQPVSLKEKEEIKGESNLSQHKPPPQAMTLLEREDSTAALVRVFAESISANRLPIPEPTTFCGDPLRFNDWKVSFQTLIDRKNIPGEEKLYYLQKYEWHCQESYRPLLPARHRVSLSCSMDHPRREIWQSIPHRQSFQGQA